MVCYIAVKNINTEQWNKIESSKINLCAYGHLIFDKGGKTASAISDAGKTRQLHVNEGN